jgi:sulfatase maturation enzyme AslB (radical SAM superfamily)
VGFACHGECPKNRFIKSPDGQPGHNYLCSGLRRFFAYADPYLRQFAGQVLCHRAQQSSATAAQPVIRE